MRAAKASTVCDFDANQFLRDLRAGKFDGRLHEEIRKLTDEQIVKIARLFVEQREKNNLRDKC